jgi:hypothetical protein
MASLSEAFTSPNNDAKLFERAENPQGYDELPEFVRHVKERRHILGLVGGNEVSRIAGNQVDLESDLQGITRPTTWSTARQHLPQADPKVIERNTAKGVFKVDVTPQHLPTYQLWAYPSVLAPEPLKKESCGRPEKY